MGNRTRHESNFDAGILGGAAEIGRISVSPITEAPQRILTLPSCQPPTASNLVGAVKWDAKTGDIRRLGFPSGPTLPLTFSGFTIIRDLCGSGFWRKTLNCLLFLEPGISRGSARDALMAVNLGGPYKKIKWNDGPLAYL